MKMDQVAFRLGDVATTCHQPQGERALSLPDRLGPLLALRLATRLVRDFH